MKELTMQNGDVVDAEGDGQSHTCYECDLPVGPRGTYADCKLFCSDECAQDYRDRRVIG